ncbi:MAG: hypothetical protein H7A32_01245 [Deltaproteobacteria bacterium]|nr:hypothetical protein [Deltaproteobacteria bacterium]
MPAPIKMTLADLNRVAEIIEDEILPNFDTKDGNIIEAREKHLPGINPATLGEFRSNLLFHIPQDRSLPSSSVLNIDSSLGPLLGSTLDFIATSTQDPSLKDWALNHPLFNILPRYQAITEVSAQDQATALKRRAMIHDSQGASRYQPAPTNLSPKQLRAIAFSLANSDALSKKREITLQTVDRIVREEFSKFNTGAMTSTTQLQKAIDQIYQRLEEEGIISIIVQGDRSFNQTQKSTESFDPRVNSLMTYPEGISQKYQRFAESHGLTLTRPLYRVERLCINLPHFGTAAIYYYVFPSNPRHLLNESIDWKKLQQASIRYKVQTELLKLPKEAQSSDISGSLEQGRRIHARLQDELGDSELRPAVLRSLANKVIAASSGNLTVELSRQEALAAQILLEEGIKNGWFKDKNGKLPPNTEQSLEASLAAFKEYQLIETKFALEQESPDNTAQSDLCIPVEVVRLLKTDLEEFIRYVIEQFVELGENISQEELILILKQGGNHPTYQKILKASHLAGGEFERSIISLRRQGKLERLGSEKKGEEKVLKRKK